MICTISVPVEEIIEKLVEGIQSFISATIYLFFSELVCSESAWSHRPQHEHASRRKIGMGTKREGALYVPGGPV